MKINKQDYRFFEWEKIPLFSQERDSLKKDVLKRHPRLKDFYSFFKKKESLFYKRRFEAIFSRRCCYCGISFTRVLNESDVQIDHIYSKSAKCSSMNIDEIENLAPSCSVCNYKKGNIVKTKTFAKKISPYTINAIFERDSNLYIRIAKPFISDKEIALFYNTLNLESEFYRLAYFYEYLVWWLMNSRQLFDLDNYFRLMVATIIIGEVVRSNANYQR